MFYQTRLKFIETAQYFAQQYLLCQAQDMDEGVTLEAKQKQIESVMGAAALPKQVSNIRIKQEKGAMVPMVALPISATVTAPTPPPPRPASSSSVVAATTTAPTAAPVAPAPAVPESTSILPPAVASSSRQPDPSAENDPKLKQEPVTPQKTPNPPSAQTIKATDPPANLNNNNNNNGDSSLFDDEEDWLAPVQCKICQRHYDNMTDLTSHHNAVHRKENVACLLCEKKFEGLHFLANHMRKMHFAVNGVTTHRPPTVNAAAKMNGTPTPGPSRESVASSRKRGSSTEPPSPANSRRRTDSETSSTTDANDDNRRLLHCPYCPKVCTMPGPLRNHIRHAHEKSPK